MGSHANNLTHLLHSIMAYHTQEFKWEVVEEVKEQDKISTALLVSCSSIEVDDNTKEDVYISRWYSSYCRDWQWFVHVGDAAMRLIVDFCSINNDK